MPARNKRTKSLYNKTFFNSIFFFFCWLYAIFIRIWSQFLTSLIPLDSPNGRRRGWTGQRERKRKKGKSYFSHFFPFSLRFLFYLCKNCDIYCPFEQIIALEVFLHIFSYYYSFSSYCYYWKGYKTFGHFSISCQKLWKKYYGKVLHWKNGNKDVGHHNKKKEEIHFQAEFNPVKCERKESFLLWLLLCYYYYYFLSGWTGRI
jgi:hypothetical protein